MNNLSQKNKQFNLTVASYSEIKGFKYDFAVIPWGSTEPHNFHLPYLTDSYLTQDLALDAVAKAYEQENIKGMVLPASHMGSLRPMLRELPFSLHTRYETQKAILEDIVASLNFQGIDTLVILNGHGGNNFKSMIRDLSIDYPEFTLISCDWYSIITNGTIVDARGEVHAGEMETSLMMYYHPNLVELEAAKESIYKNGKKRITQEGLPWLPREARSACCDDYSNPKNSSEEKGKEYAEAIVEKLVLLFMEITGRDNY